MQNEVDLSELGSTNGGRTKVLNKSSWIRKIAMNIHCQAYNPTAKA